MATVKDDFTNKVGAVTMPTKPSTGRIKRQTHETRTPAEGYNSNDDAMSSNYGKLTGSQMDHSRRQGS